MPREKIMSREAGKTEKDGKEKKLQYRILFDKSVRYMAGIKLISQ